MSKEHKLTNFKLTETLLKHWLAESFFPNGTLSQRCIKMLSLPWTGMLKKKNNNMLTVSYRGEFLIIILGIIS